MTMRVSWCVALAAVLAAGTAHAQSLGGDAPMPLFPSSGAPPAPLQVQIAPSGISIGGLSDVDPEAVGILSASAAEPWRRDLGTQVWFGQDRLAVLAGLKTLPAASVSAAARGMARQLLLTAAAPMSLSGTPATPGVLAAARLDALIAAGDAEDALALAALVPRSVQSEAVQLAVARAAWLKRDVKAACAGVEEGLQRFDAPVWGKMNAACAAAAGATDKARLSVSLLTDLGAVDEAFAPVADRIQGRTRLSLAELPASIGVFEAGALAALDAKFPEGLPLAAKPWLARLAVPKDGTVGDGALAIVEEGLRRGAIPAAEAQAVLERVAFPKADVEEAKALKADAATPRGRALYWQMLKAAPSAPARAEILARMLAPAHADPALWPVLSALLAQPLADLSTEPAAAWLAGDAARAAFWNGDWTVAKRWVELAARNGGGSDAARTVSGNLAPLVVLVDAPAAAQDRARMAVPTLAVWQKLEEARGVAPASLKTVRDRLLALYRVFSLPASDADWRAALADPAAPAAAPAASPVLAAATLDAAQKGALGRTLMLAAQQLDAGDGKPVSAAAADGVAAALLAVGAADWAKRVAVESLIAAGY
ncbi:hypothetical protein [Oleispirillum naphthae]|uniref:hypothetical protein n=1 Tax=Oleispirillum naphthae TaxID=2838853 RepID=UPI00308268D8